MQLTPAAGVLVGIARSDTIVDVESQVITPVFPVNVVPVKSALAASGKPNNVARPIVTAKTPMRFIVSLHIALILPFRDLRGISITERLALRSKPARYNGIPSL